MRIIYPQGMLHVLSVYILTGEYELSEHEGFFSLGYSQKRQEFKLRLHVGIDHGRPGRSKHLMSQARLNGR